jgi:alcohol dehydrogenase (cytochrome c)
MISYASSRIAVLAAAFAFAGVALPAFAQEVTPERLVAAQQAEPQNWLLPYGNYQAYSHSPLDEITKENVGDLKVKFLHAIGGGDPASVGGNNPGQRATPLVKDGMMYVQNAWDEVLKIDVSSGDHAETLWNADLGAQASASKMGSVALLGNYVYYVTRGSMTLVKMDDETGDIIWEMPTRGPDNIEGAEKATAGVLAVGDKIITGAAGPAMRGWIAAFSAETGDLLWRFYTIPGPNEAGHETWADDHNAYLTGGAGVWSTASYDPDTNLIIFGTGEAQPWADTSFRPGDNLYANSTVAVNADTGALAWHFQEVAQETWDYDTVNMKMLYDINHGGQTHKVVGTFSRNGFFYTMDRTDGSFLFATPYRDPNWTAGINPETGKPVEYVEGQLSQKYAGTKTLEIGDPTTAQDVCPALPTATWWPPAYDPERKIAWIQAIDACFSQKIEAPIDPTRTDLAGNPGMWGGGNFWQFDNAFPNAPGLIIGVNTETGEKVQEIKTPFATNSGLLSTAGGLVFSGSPDGKLTAYDADTLKELWSFNLGTPIGAPPISYSVGDKQYIAVITGGSRGQGPVLSGYENASQIAVFGL